MRVSPRNVLLAVTSAVVIYTLASHSRLHQGAATGENLLSSPVRSIPQNGMDTSAFTPWEAKRAETLPPALLNVMLRVRFQPTPPTAHGPSPGRTHCSFGGQVSQRTVARTGHDGRVVPIPLSPHTDLMRVAVAYGYCRLCNRST